MMNSSYAHTWLGAAFIILLFVTAIWIISLVKRNASIMDVYWGVGFILLALFYFVVTDGYHMRKSLVLSLTLLWGLRLTLHIGLRNAGKPEDARYQAWRKSGGTGWWWKSYLKVFLLQGAIMWVVSLPLLSAHFASLPKHLSLFDFAGIVIWLSGFFFESIADWQLNTFKKNPTRKGNVCSQGLWKYTRHPNYFGEALIWWGNVMFALSVGHYFTIVSALLMTFLLMRVSGVAMLDKLLLSTKPDYADYVMKTNAFFPGLPKRGK